MQESYEETICKLYGKKELEYKPNIAAYIEADTNKSLCTYILYWNDTVIGYSNIFLYEDLFTSVLSAQEDMIYVREEHRNGIGTKFTKCIMQDLSSRGVFMLNLSPIGEGKLDKILTRLGFDTITTYMRYIFKDKDYV